MPEATDKFALALRVGITYKEAWRTLAMCFGERMQDDELDLMDAVPSGVKLDSEERQDAIQNKTTE